MVALPNSVVIFLKLFFSMIIKSKYPNVMTTELLINDGPKVCNVGVQRNKKIIHFTSRLYEIMLILRVDLVIYSIK